ncbi:16S rRNA methyltransferase RsmG [Candidatus Termititenax persephonae]|uniref:Ribosomal RNA small subunit methyltransferase G n=1 Tax=Candidatus Termititenax persephonae TaxID=2218525 RepID=A0A388TJY0_9BACT|nr:16S rRNA methyltransferase RsmG [Candidatus Termititenax persephonae]
MNPFYEKLFALQTAYNAHTNITRISSREDFYVKHIEDSLALLPFLETDSGAGAGAKFCLFDLGTGAGYPGLPLAIERPGLRVTLNDATLKKIKYVQSVLDALPLPNTEAVWARAEKLGQQREYRGRYDFVAARAVAEIKELLQLSAPFLRLGGRVLLMKAKNVDAEISAAKRTAARNELSLLDVVKYKLANMDRAIVVYTKQ